MERITCRQPIAEAIDLLPPGLRRRVEHVDFLTGVDPCFVGLHGHTTFEGAGGRVSSYASVAHVTWGTMHLDHLARSDRATTVVLPRRTEYDLTVVLHELGHALDEEIGWLHHEVVPVNWYAHENAWEAFAEAFVCYIAPDLAAADAWSAYDLDAARSDAQTIALFNELAQ